MTTTNEVLRYLHKSEEPVLAINEIFKSIQGEGYTTGKPSIFIRTNGCSVGCLFCDTAYSWSEIKENSYLSFDDIYDVIGTLDYNRKIKNVVITGGEPGQQPHLLHFVEKFLRKGMSVTIETSGAFDFFRNFEEKTFLLNQVVLGNLWIVVSPKAMPVKLSVSVISEFKFLYAGGLKYLDSVPDLEFFNGCVTVQPIETSGINSKESKENRKYLIRDASFIENKYFKNCRDFRVLLQSHKFWRIR